MTNTNHPRKFRLTRCTPGVDWSDWTHTYHSTEALAVKAADKFFAGKGHYITVRGERLSTSYVILSQRVGEGRFVRYEEVRVVTARMLGVSA